MLILLVGLDARAVDSLRPCLAAVAPVADVSVVHDSQEIQAEFFGRRPDVVVIDVGTLGTRGWTLAHALRRRWDGAVIVLADGKPSTESFRTRCDAYVAKPFEPQQLMDSIAFLVPQLARRSDRHRYNFRRRRLRAISENPSLRLYRREL